MGAMETLPIACIDRCLVYNDSLLLGFEQGPLSQSETRWYMFKLRRLGIFDKKESVELASVCHEGLVLEQMTAWAMFQYLLSSILSCSLLG